MNEWDRQPGEPMLWYSRFTKFRLQGPRRSPLGVYNEERALAGTERRAGVPGAWTRALVKWRWRERAEAWDKAEQERVEAEWGERRAQIRERDFAQSLQLRDLAQKILDEGPKFIKSRRRVSGTQEIITVALDGHLAVKALEASSKLQRLAAEMADPAQKVDITSGGKTISVREVVVEIPKETDGADE